MNIIDRSYLTLTGKDRLSKKERDKYKIIAYEFNPGSLHIDLAIGPYIDALKADQLKVNILREMAASLTGKPYLKRVLLVGFPGIKPNQGKLF